MHFIYDVAHTLLLCAPADMQLSGCRSLWQGPRVHAIILLRFRTRMYRTGSIWSRAAPLRRARGSAIAAAGDGRFNEAGMKGIWIDRLRREPAAAAALAIFVLSAATLLGAWYFELVLNLPPCPLCLEQRLPYHVVILLSLLTAIAALVRAPSKLVVVGF